MTDAARFLFDFFVRRQWVPFVAAVVSLATVVSDTLGATEFGWGAVLPLIAAVAQWGGVYSRATHDAEISDAILDTIELLGAPSEN